MAYVGLKLLALQLSDLIVLAERLLLCLQARLLEFALLLARQFLGCAAHGEF